MGVQQEGRRPERSVDGGPPGSADRTPLAVTTAVLCLLPFGLLTALVVAGWSPLERFDRRVTSSVNDVVAARPALVDGLHLVTDVFSPWAFRVAALVLAVGLMLRGLRVLAVWVFVTVWTAGLLNSGLKLLVDRARPEPAEPVAFAGGLSFPSGHALGAAVGCAVLLVVAWPYLARTGKVVLVVLACVVAAVGAFARVGLGVHYPSDVVAGVVLGFAWVAGCAAVLCLVLRRRDTPSDDALPAR